MIKTFSRISQRKKLKVKNLILLNKIFSHQKPVFINGNMEMVSLKKILKSAVGMLMGLELPIKRVNSTNIFKVFNQIYFVLDNQKLI